MRTPSKEDVYHLETRYLAASSIVDAKLKEFGAHLMVADPSTRETSRQSVLFAMEAMLDCQDEYITAQLAASGIDPFTRHIGPEIHF